MWPFHRHKWQIVSASCDGRDHYNLGPGPAFSLLTHAVGKCECGKIKNFTFYGHHTLESLKGEDPAVSAVLKSLER